MAQGPDDATWTFRVIIWIANADDPPSNECYECEGLDSSARDTSLAHWGRLIKVDLYKVDVWSLGHHGHLTPQFQFLVLSEIRLLSDIMIWITYAEILQPCQTGSVQSKFTKLSLCSGLQRV